MAKQIPFNSRWPDETSFEQALRQGNNKAFDRLYITSMPKVRNYVRMQNGNDDDVDEVFQLAMYKLIEKLNDPTFELTAKVTTYVFSIAKYTWWNTARRRGLTVSYDPDPLFNGVDEPDPDPLDNLDPIDSVEVDSGPLNWVDSYLPSIEEVIDYIKAMGHPCSNLLLDHFFARTSFEEMAVEEGARPATIRKRSFDCRERVKKHFIRK